jgi:hypothetical protein
MEHSKRSLESRSISDKSEINETENKFCNYCNKSIDINKLVKHNYSKKHRLNFRKIMDKPLTIDKKDYNIQTVKLELLELTENLKQIINKISNL